MLTIIIPAYNEESVICECLDSLLQQKNRAKEVFSWQLEVLVVANGCADKTVQLCEAYRNSFDQKHIFFNVFDLKEGNKNKAINYADACARFSCRMYLDADVICEPNLINQSMSLLDNPFPCYVSGQLEIKDGSSFVSRAYGKIWRETPYIRDTIPGCGCYAVNEAGRKLWDQFPLIHSDDKYVRLLFNAKQRYQTEAKYFWPLPQGFSTLLKIRIRWIHGNRQLAFRFPELAVNDSKRIHLDADFLKIVLLNPISTSIFLCVYFTAAACVYLRPQKRNIRWSRAR